MRIISATAMLEVRDSDLKRICCHGGIRASGRALTGEARPHRLAEVRKYCWRRRAARLPFSFESFGYSAMVMFPA